MHFSFPPAVQAIHLNNFCQRLTHHLKNTPGSLMATQEAFCKAGGYPNAHAAQQNILKQKAFFGTKSNNHSVDTLPSVAPKYLFEWVKRAWKKHRAHLSLPTQITTQTMLAEIWGYALWENIELSLGKSDQFFANKPLSASTLDKLCNVEAAGRTKRPAGLYFPLGRDQNKWVGTSVFNALCHTLVFGPSPAQQVSFMTQLAVHRLRQGDTLLAFVGKGLPQVGAAITSAATAQGQTVEHIARHSHLLVPAHLVQAQNKALTADWLRQWVNSAQNPVDDPGFGLWLEWVAEEWLGQWANTPSNTLGALLDGRASGHALWTTLKAHTQERLIGVGHIIQRWGVRVVELTAGSIVLVDMPHINETEETELVWGRVVRSAYNPCYDLLSSNPKISENWAEILDPPKNQRPLTSWLFFHADPSSDVLGAAVSLAQARAVGRAITISMQHYNPQWSEETKSVLGSFHTKILTEVREGKVITGRNLTSYTPYHLPF